MAADIAAVPAKTASKNIWQERPTWTLIGSNLLIIVFAVVFNVGALSVMLAYWMESVVIGVLNVIRMLTLPSYTPKNPKHRVQAVVGSLIGKLFFSVFFALHYGGFHYVYLMFITTALPSLSGEKIMRPEFIIAAASVLFLQHLINFITERVTGTDSDKATILDIISLMFRPYMRIFPLHLTIIFGGIAGIIVMQAGRRYVTLAFLGVFVLVKAFVDLKFTGYFERSIAASLEKTKQTMRKTLG